MYNEKENSQKCRKNMEKFTKISQNKEKSRYCPKIRLLAGSVLIIKKFSHEFLTHILLTPDFIIILKKLISTSILIINVK